MRAHMKFFAAGSLAALAVAASASAQTIAITGGTVYPVSGPKIEHGTVVIANGKVLAVGANVPIPAGATRIDATGKWVTPGLFNAATTLGLAEGNPGSGGYNESRAKGDQGVAASFNAWEGMNPASTFIPATRKDGITTAMVAPAAGQIISGRAAIVDLNGQTVASMLVRAPVAMIATLTQGTDARGEQYEHLRTILSDAKVYGLRKLAYENGAIRPLAASREDLAALAPVVAGTMPLIVTANRVSDIRAALGIAKEFGLKLVIEGGAEAWEAAKELAAAHVAVMAGAMNNIPNSFSSLGHRQENLAILRAAGVQVIIIGDGGGLGEDNYNARNVRYEAGNAVAYGMKWDDALKAITMAPAEVMGVADRVGSLQPGREADVVVWSGDPFEFATVAEHVYVRGVENLQRTRQDELTDRYKNQPPTYRKP
ncbi:MAG: amidohydrolase family protein [Gemmatimonadaceae bacterium]